MTTNTVDPHQISPSENLLKDLVLANRILYHYGVVDGFGHVSVRHDKTAHHFLLSRNLAPAKVTQNDILIHNENSDPINAGDHKPYLERFLHGEIYKAHPHVTAIVHSHAHSLIPFGVVQKNPLKPLWHMAGFLETNVPVYDIKEKSGDGTDLLITDTEKGAHLANKMKGCPVVLMRGHGATVTGKSIAEAVFRAIYTQLNADIQLKALPLGDITFLSSSEAQTASRNIGSQIDRAWKLWCEEVETNN